MRRIPHDSVYTDRLSERALCYDFPADKAFIDGLHAMQSYFVARGSNIDIPVVRVMNTVHWLVAYLYATSCSGEQLEYDAMTYNSVGRDKQLMYVSLIVLIAMLNRTEGARAKACRSMMLEGRTEDFYEGVSLYEQWLDGGLEHYTDEDFQIDLMDELNEYKTKYNLAQKEIYQLQKQLNMKDEEKQPVTNIFNGPYIANNYVQEGGKQILSAENVYWSDSEKPEIGLPETTQVDAAKIDYCMYICREKLQDQGIYTIDEFEQMMADASKGIASDFAGFLKRYKAQGVLDFMSHSKKQIFENLRAHYAEMRQYAYPNFAAAF